MAKIYYDNDADLNLLKDKTIAIIGYGIQGHPPAKLAVTDGFQGGPHTSDLAISLIINLIGPAASVQSDNVSISRLAGAGDDAAAQHKSLNFPKLGDCVAAGGVDLLGRTHAAKTHGHHGGQHHGYTDDDQKLDESEPLRGISNFQPACRTGRFPISK